MTPAGHERREPETRRRDLRTITDIREDEIKSLEEAEYASRSALEGILDHDPPARKIEQVAKATGIEVERLVQLLAASLSQRGQSLSLSWSASHWLDVLLALLAVIFITLAAAGTIETLRSDRAAAAEREGTRAVAAREILPYVPLRSEDVLIVNADSDEESLVSAIVGRYSSRLISSNETIHPRALSAPVDLAGHFVIRIVLKQAPAIVVRTFPVDGNLLLSARELPQSSLRSPIVLLDMDTDGLGAVIAIPEDRFPAFAGQLGSSDAYLHF